MTFQSYMISGVKMQKEKLLAKNKGCKNTSDPRKDIRKMIYLFEKSKTCKYGEVEKHACMLKAIKLERKAREREVQKLHKNCKDGER